MTDTETLEYAVDALWWFAGDFCIERQGWDLYDLPGRIVDVSKAVEAAMALDHPDPLLMSDAHRYRVRSMGLGKPFS